MHFEFYVLNYDFNGKKVQQYNIFNNLIVAEDTEKEIKKFLRNQKKYSYKPFYKDEEYYGFEAFCQRLKSIIMYQEWSRREYEISVGDAFETDINKFEKWDCYKQAEPNIQIIAREVIYQYKEQIKNKE